MAAANPELDIELAELEVRLERLRALYEQYFLGIERVEPSVPRQDVDRRIAALRKARIRNTARRHKLQTLLQRYTSFQQYWVRVCRQIENGSYYRHVARAEARYGNQGLRAVGRPARTGGSRGADAERSPLAQQAGSEPVEHAPADDGAAPSSVRLGADGESEVSEVRLVGATQAASPPAPPSGRPEPALGAQRGPLPAPERSPSELIRLLDHDPRAALERALQAAAAASQRPPSLADALRLPSPSRPEASGGEGRLRPGAPVAAPALGARAVPPPRRSPPKDTGASPQQPLSSGESTSGGLSPKRVDALHQRLSDEMRRLNQPGKVSRRALEEHLRATEAKLRDQYAGRSIDFEIVVSEGKARLKPIVGA